MSHIEPYTWMKIDNRTLKTERKRRGWTQARLAKVLGVTTRTVIRWEQGFVLPHPTHQAQLETLFGWTGKAEQLDLGWDMDENKAIETDESKAVDLVLPSSFHAADQAMSEVQTPKSLLVDPTIWQTLGSTSLLGRTELLMQVKERLFNADCLPFTGLYGLPGVGKTTLVTSLAADPQVRAHFGDGILWAPLGSQPHVLGQLIRWGMQMGVATNDAENPEDQQAWRQTLRSAIGNRQMLLIIDDAWTVEDVLALQIGGVQCTHLMTTCQPQVAQAFAQEGVILMPQLEEADGLALLARYVPQLVQQDAESARSLVRAVDSLPLTLTLMGKYLALALTLTQHPWPLRDALAHLQDTQQHLLGLHMPTASRQHWSSLTEIMPLSLCAAIAICDQQLSLQAHTALCNLTIFPPKPHSFSEEAALVLSRQPRKTLEELCRIGLLESYSPGRYTLHQTVADYVHAIAHNSDWSALWSSMG